MTFDLKHSDYLETIEAEGTVQAVKNNILITPRVYSNLKVAYLAKEGSFVKLGDTVCILSATDLMTAFEQFKTDLEKMEGEKRSLEAKSAMQLSLLEAQVATNNAKMEITMLDSVQLKFAPPVKQKLIALEMEKVKIEKRKLEKKLTAQQIIDKSELSQIGSRIMIQNNRIQTYQAQINSLKLTAPCDGYVMHSEGPTFYTGDGSTIGGKIEEGTRVFSNMALLQIPDNGKMQVSVEVQEADYKRINNNQKVQITVEAASNLRTTGKIDRKSLANKNRDEKSQIKSYEIIISVDSCDIKMKPGLSAYCKIFIDEVKDTIVIPASAIFTRDSTKIVYVADDDKFLPVAIETGTANSSETIVTRGLSGNETLALTEPPHFMIRNGLKYLIPDTTKLVTDKTDSLIRKTSQLKVK